MLCMLGGEGGIRTPGEYKLNKSLYPSFIRTNTGLLLTEILMLGDRCARHSVIVEVESDTDKNIEQRQASGGRMFPAHTQAGKKADRSKMVAKNAENKAVFLIFQRTISD